MLTNDMMNSALAVKTTYEVLGAFKRHAVGLGSTVMLLAQGAVVAWRGVAINAQTRILKALCRVVMK